MENTQSSIAIAFTRPAAQTPGHCHVILCYRNSDYSQSKLSMLLKVCGDVLLRHYFVLTRKKTEMSFGGSSKPFSLCNLVTACLDPPPLFVNLSPNCIPTAGKSRQHSALGECFIWLEIENILKERIIAPPNSL
ncbi:uncharacterized protein DEA37_0007045 [Paragonimus westermani]|uniref:Uncharacterized protein n=1 Tax=Paragonimus westermani TaxID=34504 RepID=A0A5J4NZA6_9TREM|nr:uncharacterized protein DEA37_0007045 [Paragonimus westermani]